MTASTAALRSAPHRAGVDYRKASGNFRGWRNGSAAHARGEEFQSSSRHLNDR
jgi:hypothetical protein